jgi:transcriptional regulator with XRE-family HTH domain
MKKYLFKVEKTGTGFSAFAEDDKLFVSTTGKDMMELKQNIFDAMNLYRDHKGLKPVSESDISIRLDVKQFFEYYNVINAKALGERIGMSQSLLSQYANGIKIPSEKQTQKILGGIKNLGKELTELEFK